MVNSMAAPYKTKDLITIWPNPGHFSGKKTLIPKDACIPMFTAALFTGGTTCNFFFFFFTAKTEEIKRIKTV